MKDAITVNWTNGMAFESEVDGFTVKMDAKQESGGGGNGARPKPLMMVALAGCTGMDVISILRKMRIEVDDFDIHVEGEITEEHPKQFSHMHLIYEFAGKDLPMDKLEKAVDLSQERYCGVSASYRKAFELTYEIKIRS